MPLIGEGPPGGGADDLVLYPVDTLRDVAAAILTRADLAREEHDRAWATVQSWLEAEPYGGMDRVDFGGDDSRWIEVRFYLKELLEPYARRLRAAYDWQISFAQALFALVDRVGALDQQLQGYFSGEGGEPPVSHGHAPSSGEPPAL